MVIRTYFSHKENGARITAKVTDKGKRKQLTIDYPYHLRTEKKHERAAQRLYVKLFGQAARFQVECMPMSVRHTYEFKPIDVI